MGATKIQGSIKKDDRPYVALDDDLVKKRIKAHPDRPFYALVKFQPTKGEEDYESGGERTEKVRVVACEVYGEGAETIDADNLIRQMYQGRTGAKETPVMAFEGMAPDGSLTGVPGEAEVVDDKTTTGPWPGDADYVPPDAAVQFDQGQSAGDAAEGQADAAESSDSTEDRPAKAARKR